MIACRPFALGATLVVVTALAWPASAASGRLDRSFGRAGTVMTPFPKADSWEAMHLDGRRLLVAGTSAGDVVVARYLRDGRLDPSFGADGTVRTDLGAREVALGIAVSPTHRVLVVGTEQTPGASFDFLFIRYLRDGSLDPSFGNDGTVTIDQGQRYEWAHDAMFDGRHRIVAVGQWGAEVEVLRLRPDGSLDPTFGNDGIERPPLHLYNAGADAVAPAAHGKILVAGHDNHEGCGEGGGCSNRHLVLRLNPNGRMDRSFGTGGWTDQGFDDLSTECVPCPVTLARAPTGRLYVASNEVVAAYTRDGRIFRRFGGDGHIAPGKDVLFETQAPMVVLSEGKVVIAGGYRIDRKRCGNCVGGFALQRFLANGDIDRTFGPHGTAWIDLGRYVNAAVLQRGGKMVVVGNLRKGWGLARFLAS